MGHSSVGKSHRIEEVPKRDHKRRYFIRNLRHLALTNSPHLAHSLHFLSRALSVVALPAYSLQISIFVLCSRRAFGNAMLHLMRRLQNDCQRRGFVASFGSVSDFGCVRNFVLHAAVAAVLAGLHWNWLER